MWTIEYDNDVGPNDEGYWWWNVADGNRTFEAKKKEDAEWLCDLLNTHASDTPNTLFERLRENVQKWVDENYTSRFSALGVVTDDQLSDVLKRAFNEANASNQAEAGRR
jgi:hypothetical protein